MPGTYLCTDIYIQVHSEERGAIRGGGNKQANTVEMFFFLFFLMYNSRLGKQNTEGIGGCVFLIILCSLMRCGLWVVGQDVRCEM